MTAWLTKHSPKILLLLCIVLLVPVLFITQHFYEKASLPKTLQTQQGMFKVDHWTTENGAKVVFVELPELPMLDIRVLFYAGSAYDGDKFGLANMTSQLMGLNTSTLDTQTIHETFESAGSIFNSFASRDMSGVELRTLTETKHLKQSLDMFNTLLKDTVFDETTFKREQERMLTALTLQKQSPADLAQLAFFKAIYGEHPYAHPVMGDETTVSALTPQDLEAFFKAHYVEANAVIAIVGDVDLEEAHRIATEINASLPKGVKAPPVPALTPTTASQEHITFPSSQTHILMGAPSIAKGNPDYYALTVGNNILGEAPLKSDLAQEVREKNGLAYSVGSYISTLEQPGPFLISLQTRGEETQKALKLVNKTVDTFLSTGPTDAQIKDAKENINGRFLLGLASNSAIVNHVATVAFYDLPWDYQDTFVENINAVTPEAIHAAFQKYVKPETFAQVTVGEHD